MSKPADDPDAAFRRAADFNDNFLSLPGYADDSMFFCLRYGEKARNTMRQKDYDDFMAKMDALMRLWSRPADEPGGLEARYKRIAEVRAEALEQMKEYPELHKDFDQFVACSRAFKRSLSGSNMQTSSGS